MSLPTKVSSLSSLTDQLFHGKVSNSLTINPRKIVPRTNKDGTYRLLTKATSNDGCLGSIHLNDRGNGGDKVAVALIYVLPNKRIFKDIAWEIRDNQYYVDEFLKNSLKEGENPTQLEEEYNNLCQKFLTKSSFDLLYSEHLSREAYLNGLIAGARKEGYYKDFILKHILPLLKKEYDSHKIPIHNVVDFKKDLQDALDKIDHRLEELLKIDKDNMSSFIYVISSNQFEHGDLLKLIKDKIGYLSNRISSMHMTKWGQSFESESDWED